MQTLERNWKDEEWNRGSHLFISSVLQALELIEHLKCIMVHGAIVSLWELYACNLQSGPIVQSGGMNPTRPHWRGTGSIVKVILLSSVILGSFIDL